MPVTFKLLDNPRERFLFMIWRNTGIGLLLAVVLAAVQLGRMSDMSALGVVFASPLTAGLFIPPSIFGVWMILSAIQDRAADRETTMKIHGDRLTYFRPATPSMLRDERHLVYQLAALEGFALKPAGKRCTLALTQSGVLTAIPVERVGYSNDDTPLIVEGWEEHPLVDAIKEASGAEPQWITD